jgi:hypothetical protein
MSFDETAFALQEMTDHARFERMVSTLLAREDPRIRPLGGTGDRGRDAVGGLYRYGRGEELICMYSLEDEWDGKIRRELKHIADEGWKPKQIIAVTSQKTTRAREDRLQEEAGQAGVDLTVLGRDALAVKLETPRNLDLREDYLSLPRPRHPFFLAREAFADLLAARGAVLETPFVGRDGDIAALAELMRRATPVVLVDGDGGLGKSRLALELAERDQRGVNWFFGPDGQRFEPDMVSELGAGDEIVVVIDDAHNRADLREMVGALGRRRPPAQVLLLARPGFRDRMGVAVDGLFGAGVEAITIAPLMRPDIVAILEAPPFSMTREGLIAVIVEVAEGNPQIAAIAGQLSLRGERVDALNRDQLFARYARSVVDKAAGGSRVREDLLAIIAALRTLSPDDKHVVERIAQLTGLSGPALRRELYALADAGPVIERNGVYMIKPDVLSEQVLRHSFFALERKPLLAYGDVYAAFAPLGRTPLLEAIGAAGVDETVADRLRPVRNDLANANAHVDLGAQSYARFIRALAPGLPHLALELYDDLVERLPALDDRVADEVTTELARALVRIGYIDLAWPRLMQLGPTIFARDLDRADAAWREAVIKVYERLPVDMYEDEGRILAIVQEVTGRMSAEFWDGSDKSYAAAKSAAIAARGLLTMTFETHRQAPANRMQYQLRAHCLPASQFTRDVLTIGARLFRESLLALMLHEQVEQLDKLDDLVRVACAFEGAFGLKPDGEQQELAREVLATEIEPWLREHIDELALPVAADVRDHFAWRARHDDTVAPLSPSGQIIEYYDLIHPTHHREIGVDFNEQQQRQVAIGRDYARALATSDDPIAMVDRWRDWLAQAETAKGRLPWHASLRAVFDAIAVDEPKLAGRLAEHLRTNGGLLLGYADGLVRRLGDDDVSRWATSDDPNARAIAAWAVSGRGDAFERHTLEALARDPEEGVRRRVWRILYAGHGDDPRLVRLLLNLTDAGEPDELSAIVRNLADDNVELDSELVESVRTKLLTSAEFDHIEGHSIQHALAELKAFEIDLTFEWVWLRLQWIKNGGRDSYRDLPDEVVRLLHGRRGHECWKFEYGRLVAMYEESDLPYSARSAIARAIGALAGDTNELTGQIRAWATSGEEGLALAYPLLDTASTFDTFTERARILLHAANTRQTRSAIAGAQEMGVFSGPISEHYRRRADRFRPWLKEPDPLLAELARDLITDFDHAAEHYEEDERREAQGY